LDGPAGFLTDLAADAVGRVLAEFELAARQLPFVALVAQQ
jgi:hypothetical protein